MSKPILKLAKQISLNEITKGTAALYEGSLNMIHLLTDDERRRNLAKGRRGLADDPDDDADGDAVMDYQYTYQQQQANIRRVRDANDEYF